MNTLNPLGTARSTQARFLRTLALSAIAIAARPVSAATIHVPADQPTIQSAIAAARNGDKVVVAPGTYHENINFLGKSISVIGALGAKKTVIDGGQLASVVVFDTSETKRAVLKGFTLQNGFASSATAYSGAAIYMYAASPTVTNNIVVNNLAAVGAAVDIEFASPKFSGNQISATLGGGIYVGGIGNATIVGNSIQNNTGTGIELFNAGTPVIEGNIISGNTSQQGGGISMFNISNAYVANNLIVGNTTQGYFGQGGGVYIAVPEGEPGPVFVNNTVAGNTSYNGSEIYIDGFDNQTIFANNIIYTTQISPGVLCDAIYQSKPPQFINNDVFSPTGATIGGSCATLLSGNGNLAADPLFTGSGALRTQHSLSAGSPAIDAGNNAQASGLATDILGNPRLVDGNSDGSVVIDIGAYEFQPN